MGFVKNTIGGITGSSAAKAARQGAAAQTAATQDAIARQEQASQQALGFLSPYGQIGQQGLDQASFLTDPTQQFEYLQSNPLFKLALENANMQSQQSAAAGGRLSAGDTLQQLSNNVLLQGSPLIAQQSQNIAGLMDFGRGVAGMQANAATGAASQISPLLQDIGNIQAGGLIGAANARGQGVSNLISLGTMAAGAYGGLGGGTSGLTPAATRFPGTSGSVGFGGGIGL